MLPLLLLLLQAERGAIMQIDEIRRESFALTLANQSAMDMINRDVLKAGQEHVIAI
jgi:hypothetical protein